MPARDPSQLRAQPRLLLRTRWARQAVNGAMRADDPARPPFGNPEPSPQVANGPAATVRGQKFPVMMVAVSAGVV